MDSPVIPLEKLRSVKESYSLAGKTAVITGGAGGIGYAVSAAVAEMGAAVVLVDLRQDVAQRHADFIAGKFGVRAMSIECDVTDEQNVEEMFVAVAEAIGPVNLVHSNAGITISGGDNADMPIESWRRMVDVNLTSMFIVNRVAARLMRDRGEGGVIVNTASMSGHIVNRNPDRHLVAYTSTKAAVVHLTKAMAMDFHKDLIRVNSISPGYMYSGLHNHLPQERLDAMARDVPMGRFGSMNEIGGIVAFLFSENASYITGADLLVDGGYCCW
ncbi:MAG: SDR family oxidoreductase [Planctomycetaceae bacterium]|nr:SDR family oxidoreductase [Planctomycetaceae bacterium]